VGIGKSDGWLGKTVSAAAAEETRGRCVRLLSYSIILSRWASLRIGSAGAADGDRLQERLLHRTRGGRGRRRGFCFRPVTTSDSRGPVGERPTRRHGHIPIMPVYIYIYIHIHIKMFG